MQPTKLRSLLAFDTALLVLANLVTIVFFVRDNGSILQVLWVYWLQNIVIGAVNIARIISFPSRFSFGQQNLHVSLGEGTGSIVKLMAIIFFLSHYGAFHVVYLFALLSFSSSQTETTFDLSNLGQVDSGAVLVAGIVFALHHGLSFIFEQRELRASGEVSANSFELMKKPYARIIPIHLVVVLAVPVSVLLGSTWVFVLFMVLKTVVDVGLHNRGTSHVVYPGLA